MYTIRAQISYIAIKYYYAASIIGSCTCKSIQILYDLFPLAYMIFWWKLYTSERKNQRIQVKSVLIL